MSLLPPHVVIVVIKCISFGKSSPQIEEQNRVLGERRLASDADEEFSRRKGLKKEKNKKKKNSLRIL